MELFENKDFHCLYPTMVWFDYFYVLLTSGEPWLLSLVSIRGHKPEINWWELNEAMHAIGINWVCQI